MIEDLIFKGKTLEDAKAKASNFFGVSQDTIEYTEIDSGEPGTVAIKLTENPIMPRKQESDKTEHARYGLLRSDSLPKQPPRQYEHPQKSEDESGTKRNWKPKQQQERPRHRKAEQNPRTFKGNDRRTDRRGGGPKRGRNDGRKNFRTDRQERAPRNDQPDWKPAQLDVSEMGEFERKAYEFVMGILKDMNMRADAKPIHDDDRIIMNINGPDRNLLLNRKGEPLVAIQYLVNKIFLGPGKEDQKPVYVDSQGYRVARDEELHDIAVASAEKVKSSGKEYSLNPMNPYERRQIHLALKEHSEVETVSRGSGYIKRVSIIPAR